MGKRKTYPNISRKLKRFSRPSEIVFSCIIPSKLGVENNPNLQVLIKSIQAQDFPQDQIEIIVETRGDSESAKAMAIRRAKGEILCLLCDDNLLVSTTLFSAVKHLMDMIPIDGYYSKRYFVYKEDCSLNRYFSLLGANDVIPWFLGKADRASHDGNGLVLGDFVRFGDSIPSLGDNGFFVRRNLMLEADLDHYYPMDCFDDLNRKGHSFFFRDGKDYIWHRTILNNDLIGFLKRRYKYARDLYCERNDRRWKVIGSKKDIANTIGFVVYTLTIICPLIFSIRKLLQSREWCWLWHLPVCAGFLMMYGILTVNTCLKRLLSFQR